MSEPLVEQRELIQRCEIGLVDTEYGPSVAVSINDKHFVSMDAESMWKLAASIMIQVRKVREEQGISDCPLPDDSLLKH